MSAQGFTVIPRWLLYRESLSKHAKLAYAVIASHADETGSAWPSIATIAREGSMGMTSTKAGLRELLRLGVIERRARHRPDGGQTSSVYRLTGVSTPCG